MSLYISLEPFLYQAPVAGFTQLPWVLNCLWELRPASMALMALMPNSQGFPSHNCALQPVGQSKRAGVSKGTVNLLGLETPSLPHSSVPRGAVV